MGGSSKRGAALLRPACTGRKTGGVFVSGSEQKACPFSGSGGRYTSPRPSSPVSKTYIEMRCVSVDSWREEHRPRHPKSKEAGKHPWGLPALTTTKRTRAGRSRLALKAPCTSTLTAPAGFATVQVNTTIIEPSENAYMTVH